MNNFISQYHCLDFNSGFIFRIKIIISKGIFIRVYYKEGGCFILLSRLVLFLKKIYLQQLPGGGISLWNEMLNLNSYVFENHCDLNLKVEIDQRLLTRSTNCLSSLRLLAADTPATAAMSNGIAQWIFIVKLQKKTKWTVRYTFSLYSQSVVNSIMFNIKTTLVNGYFKIKSFRQFNSFRLKQKSINY